MRVTNLIYKILITCSIFFSVERKFELLMSDLWGKAFGANGPISFVNLDFFDFGF